MRREKGEVKEERGGGEKLKEAEGQVEKEERWEGREKEK